MTRPASNVVAAIEAGLTRVQRRLEIFEADGVTPWNPPGATDIKHKMTSGSVSIDSTRDERRTLDVTLDNKDNLLRPNSDRGFWYDKVLKVYRGARFETKLVSPRILIVEHSQGTAGAVQLKSLFHRLGFTNVSINLNAQSIANVGSAVIVVSAVGDRKSNKAALLQQCFNNGKSVLTIGTGNDETVVPYFSGTQPYYSGDPVMLTPVSYDTAVNDGWTEEELGRGARGRMVVALASGVVAARSLNDGYEHVVASLKEGDRGRWFDYHFTTDLGPNARILVANALRWLWRYTPYTQWETQVGEFLIDTIKDERFPAKLSVTGRDYTKLCLLSKVERDMSFANNTSVATLIRSLAANAGVRKITLPSALTTKLGTQIDVSRGTERWKIMKDAADAHGHQLYFNAQGYLTARPYADPTLGAPDLVLRTGENGNLTEYAQAVSDARIYNHVTVIGERSGSSEELPFFGEAMNTNPNSPTAIRRIGDRSYSYSSSFFTSNQQCIDYANNLLKQVALEQFELDFSSIVYPWLDAGSVVGYEDPEANERDPDKYLMDSLTIPLGLEPMSGTGKRVLFIGNFSG